MKIKISYFYHVRNLKQYQIPVSTAVWDPKWFHENTGNNKHIFIDKRGVVNGVRLLRLFLIELCRIYVEVRISVLMYVQEVVTS